MKYPSKIDSTYRSSFHSGAGRKEVMVTVSPLCGQISQVTPSFFGYVPFFTSTQSQFFFFAGETRVEKRDRVEYSDSLVGTEAEADNVMIEIKPYLLNV